MKEKMKGNNYVYMGLKLIKILSPILLGILFAYLLNPITRKLETKVFNKVAFKTYKNNDKKAKKMSRILSIIVTYIVIAALFILFIIFVLPSLLDSLQMLVTNVPTYVNNIYDYLKDYLKSNPDLAKAIDSMNANIVEYANNIMAPSLDSFMSNLGTGITNFVSGTFNFIIGIIVSVYLLYDKEIFVRNSKKVMKAFLPEKLYEDSITTLGYTDKIFGGFMMAKIIDSLIIGVLSFVIFSIFKIPYSLVIAVIVGITNIIPYFGPFIGALPCAAFLLLISPAKCLTFLILILIIQQFDGNILGPKLIGNKTGIKSFWVLFSILLFGGLFGFIGMIFGVPVFAIIYSVIANKVNKKLAKRES